MELAAGEKLSYERLVLTLGTEAVRPLTQGKLEKERVYVVHKSLSAMTDLRDEYAKARNTVIIGGGFTVPPYKHEKLKPSTILEAACTRKYWYRSTARSGRKPSCPM
jgi:hypothetical protein